MLISHKSRNAQEMAHLVKIQMNPIFLNNSEFKEEKVLIAEDIKQLQKLLPDWLLLIV